MNTLTTITSHDRTILPLAPLLCLVKAGVEPKYLSATEEMIILEAAVDFGIGGKILNERGGEKSDDACQKSTLFSEAGWHFLNRYFSAPLTQHHISLVFSLKNQLSEESQKEPNYIEKMLFYGAKLCDLETNAEDLIAKAVMLGNIRKTLEIPEEAIAKHPTLYNLLETSYQDDIRFSLVKEGLLAQLEDGKEDINIDDYIASFPPLDGILATMTTEAIHGEFKEGIDGITESEAAGIVDEDIAEQIGDITPDKLILALAQSFSLNIEEKKRVLMAMPTLSVFQIVLLMETFLEEVTKFITLAEENPIDMQKLSIKQRLEWLMLKKDLASLPEEMHLATKVHVREMMKEAAA